MVTIIIIIIVIVVIGTAVSSLIDALEEILPIIGAIIGLIVFFAIFSWPGILILCVIGAGIWGSKVLKQHDERKKEAAKINSETEKEKRIQENDFALQNELERNCKRLGYMNKKMWEQKLSNFKDKEYSTSFETITSNFAMQVERQTITQSDEWFKPFLKYMLNHPQGTTVVKMINEVNAPQLNHTHASPNMVLLRERLKCGTRRVSKDVPPLFEEIPITEMQDSLFKPTRYAMKLYCSENEGVTEKVKQEEISFDDL